MEQHLGPSVEITVAGSDRRDSDYVSRAELSTFAARGAAIVAGIVSRSVATNIVPARIMQAAGASKPSTNAVHDTLDIVADGIVNGKDFSEHYPTIARLIHAQEQRSEVFSQLLVTNDFSRLARAVKARDRLEETLVTAAMNDDLLPAERVILLQELERVIASAQKNVSSQTSAGDVALLLEKLDYATEMAGATLRKKFSSTTAQGREVVRKLLTRVSKAVKSATVDEP